MNKATPTIMNRIEKSDLLVALYAKQEEASESVKNAEYKTDYIRFLGYKSAIDDIIQIVRDDF